MTIPAGSDSSYGDSDGRLRRPTVVGTWNLNAGQALKHRAAQGEWIREHADLWLLTEVHTAATDDIPHQVVSDAVAGMPNVHWSGIASRWPLEEVSSGNPTLALAQVCTPEGGALLVASSVLPWRAAGAYWPADYEASFADRFSRTLKGHREAIVRNVSPGQDVIWGGDFNQALEGEDTVGSEKGRNDLLDALGSLGLKALTSSSPARQSNTFSIDHIAVPFRWEGHVKTHDVRAADGGPLSDHPAYVAQLTAPASQGQVAPSP